MANNPTSPANDPAALAFSAVEDALKDSVFNLDSPTQAPADKRAAEQPRSERLRAADKIAAQAGSVANDDRFPTSKLLYNLQNKSSNAPTWIALVLSLVWLAATGVSGYLRYQEQLKSFGSFVGTIDFISLLAVMVLPVLGFFGIATLFRRAQDLRNAASSITQAAIRLAEPEITASDKVASVGQAVRREVNALGDGLERALSRAGELEVMIHNEVTALERTYSDNESRMRSLIAELASQRESVLTNTERVREAITESHTGLVFDLDMISQRIAGTIVDSGGNLTKALETAGNTLSSSFGDRTESFVSLIDNRTGDFLSALDDSAGRLSLTFEDHTASMSRNFENRQLELSSTIDSRMTALTEALDTRAADISGAIADRTTALSNLLTDGGTALLDQLRDRGHEVSGALDMIGTRIASDISGRSREAEVLLSALTRQLDESVSIQLNAMDSRLQSALIEINGALDDTSERARITLSSAGSDSLSLFDGRLTEISELLDSRLHTLDGVIGDKGDKLIEALNTHGSNFTTRANVLEMALDEQSGRFSEVVAQRTREIGETLGGHTQQLTDTIGEQTRLMDEALGNRTQRITQTIGERTREIVDSLEGHTEIIAEALDGRTQHLDQVLTTRTTDLSTSFETHARSLDESIRVRSQELGAALSGSTEAFDKAITSGTQQLATTVNTRTQQLSEALGSRTEQLSDVLGNRTEQLANVLATHTAGISDAIGERTSELASTIEAQGNTARERIDASLRSVTDTMASHVDTMSGVIGTKVGEFNANLAGGIDTAIVRISDAETGLSGRIDAATATVSDSARKAADLIESGVNSARKAITDMVDQRLGTLPEAITARADITAERLAALNASINTSITQSMADLESGADRIEETIATRLVAATTSITNDVTNTANRMDLAVRNALEQIQIAGASIDQIVSVKAVNTADSIAKRMSEINSAVTEQTNTFAALVSDKSDQLQIALLSHGNILRDALGETAREAEGIMSVSTSRILSDVSTALGKLNDSNLLLQRVLEASTSNLAHLESSVAQQTATYSTTVRDAIGQTEEAGTMVSQHVNALQATIQSMVREFSGMLGKLDAETVSIGSAAQALSNTGGFALETLEERRNAMDALASSFAARADDIDGRMRMFAQSIADTVNDTERRLIGARRAMDEALSATSSTVTDTLTATTTTITDALNANADKVNDALYLNSERVSNTLTTTSSQVDAAMLRASDAAASALNQTSNVVANALAKNTAQVNAALTETSDRVGDVLSATAGNVTDVLNSTTGTLANTISDSSMSVKNAVLAQAGTLRQALDQTSAEVTARLGDFHETADAEGQRANAALRAAQQAMMAEMQRAIEEATARFNDTASAMRDTAREVGSELEATRSELMRGVAELPEETRASAAAMRRVVAEQIEALSELNAIVRSQPATNDINTSRTPQRPPAPRQEAPRYEQPRPEPQIQRPVETYRSEPAPEPVRQPEPVRTAPPRQAAPAPVPQRQGSETVVAEQGQENGGWLRDVLRNATAKQATTQQASLSGLTEEIARSIDDGALAEAWARYQAGEANVFSRRIYTLSGQGTYDEVRKKLQREPEFARTAQAYMTEFEQLLKRAVAGPNGAAETREYLLSDRGKVYTTLAHASGRLN
ncbi:hypothetical protein [Devosia sp.]|uniref:apolipoprotein A-IV repeat region-like domain-containing protein n=1 Tax=Devosia sp. TaxID=1871048 RepID=UPI003265773C